MKQLPEKWAIKTDDPEFYEWFNKLTIEKRATVFDKEFHSNKYLHYPAYDNDYFFSSVNIQPGYELITLDFWRECVGKSGKLIGYRAPFDIPSWGMKKNSIVLVSENFGGQYYGFYLETIPSTGKYWIPTEIVETWEAVYEEDKPKKEVRTCWLIQVYEYEEFDCKIILSFIHDSYKIPVQFPTQSDCIQWVREHGEKGKYYSYHEVDYIV